jgi:hypothetical protein
MKRQFHVLAACWALAIVISGPQAVRAEIRFIGPFPYSSAADSPFNLSGLGSTFFLEDYEDFDFDETPGVADWFFGIGPGFSVDADDGAVDGQSAGLASALPQNVFTSGGTTGTALTVAFNSSDLGSYPTAFGMVFTSKDNSAGILASNLNVFDGAGALLASFDLRYALSLYSNGFDATDDVFVGVVSSDGLPIVEYQETFPAPPGSSLPPGLPARIDHLQYGLLVPEPSGWALAFAGLCYTGRMLFKTVV